MKTDEFLDILEHRNLAPASVVQQLRDKVRQSDRPISAKSVLKYLVKNEFVSSKQAKQLLETTLTVTSKAESSILGLVPLPEVPSERTPSQESSIIREEASPDPEEIPTLAPVDTQDAPPDDQPAELSGFLSESLEVSETTPGDPFDSAAKQVGGKKKKRRKKKRGKQNEWDSPLLLLGGGGLIVLLIAGVFIGYLLSRENADAILAEASDYFDGGSYTQAINQYEKFVETFPSHPQFSAARVKLGMARLWKATNGTSNFAGALKTAQQVLEAIEDEPDFGDARRDLASLLPKIAQGLANQAEKADNPDTIHERVEQAKEALSLCTNTKYIGTTFRDEGVLNEIGQTLDRVDRAQQQRADLAQALTDIQAAIDQQDTPLAHKIHERLLDKHPGLMNNQVLSAKVLEISAAEQSVVKYVAESKAAESTPRPSKVVAALALAERRGSPASGVKGMLGVRLDGAIYGLNAEDGALLWRRYVGIAPRIPPVSLPDGDLLVVDSRYNELQRLAVADGKLLWRQVFQAPISQPVVLGERLLVADLSGKLNIVELASGERLGHVQFSQPLPVPPTIGFQGRRIYVIGQHSSLYTLSAEDFSCLGVYYLGHAQGGVSVPLVAALNKVVAAVNSGVATSQLQVLATTKEGIVENRVLTRRLKGLVNTPLLVAGRRLVALTSLGQVTVYEVGSGEGDVALTQIATRDAEGGQPIARFGLLHEGHVWAAGTRLQKLAILPTGNRLPVRNVDQDYQGDTFDYPLQTIGNLLVHVRRPAGRGGAIVAAMDTASGQALWETELAVPLAGGLAVDTAGRRIMAATASGATYVLDRQAMGRRIQDQAQRLTTPRQAHTSFTTSLDLGQGRLVLATPGSDVLLHFRPDTPRGSLRAIPVPGPLSSPPVVWREGFAVPTQVGQVFLFDSETGERVGTPFQPPLAPDAEYDWLTPAEYGEGEDSRLVLSDGVEKIYLVALVAQPQPHLEAEAEVDIGASPLQTQLAVVGDLACAGDDQGRLAVFQLPSLESRPAVELGGNVTWGPFSVGDQIVLATDADQLIGIDNQTQVAWRQPFAHGPPTGRPVADGEKLYILWQNGSLSRLRLSDGTEAAHLQLEQPVVAGPVVFGKRFILSSPDGTLLVVDRP